MNLEDFSVVAQGPTTQKIHRFLISCKVTDNNGNLLLDLTGENAIQFPDILTSLTTIQRRFLIKDMARWLINMKLNPKLYNSE